MRVWERGAGKALSPSPSLSGVVLGFCFVKGDCLLAQPWFGLLLG